MYMHPFLRQEVASAPLGRKEKNSAERKNEEIPVSGAGQRMFFSMFPIASADGPALEERSYPFYIASVEDTTTEPVAVTFVNGV